MTKKEKEELKYQIELLENYNLFKKDLVIEAHIKRLKEMINGNKNRIKVG
jgi:hypothetical protein